MKALSFAALAAFFLAACGGGGQSAFVQPASLNALPLPSAAPAATGAPTTTPATTPMIAPTTAPTIAPSLKVVGGAPLTATAAQLSRVRTQSKTTAQGITNGVPILVESSGMVAAWAGSMVTWVTNAVTSQDVPQTSGTITATNGLPINNPGFTQACIGSLAAACIVHPTAWTFGTASTNGKTVGKQTLTMTFGDGTTGTTFDAVYDGWNLPCNSGWVYTAGVPVANAVKATSDVYADCVAQTIVFPKGAIAVGVPTQDQYGRAETVLPTITAAIFIGSATVNFPMATIGQGQVFGVNTQDGSMAKVYFGNAPGVAINAAQGMSLHANANLTYSF